MRWLIAVAAALCLAAPAAASRYAYTSHDVLIHQTRVQFALNHMFPALAPIPVRCRGLEPVRLRGGGNGFYVIRCTTGLAAPDFEYHYNGAGIEVLTRPASP